MKSYNVSFHLTDVNPAKVRAIYYYFVKMGYSELLTGSQVISIFLKDRVIFDIEQDVYQFAQEIWSLNGDYCDIVAHVQEINPAPEEFRWDAGDWQQWKESKNA